MSTGGQLCAARLLVDTSAAAAAAPTAHASPNALAKRSRASRDAAAAGAERGRVREVTGFASPRAARARGEARTLLALEDSPPAVDTSGLDAEFGADFSGGVDFAPERPLTADRALALFSRLHPRVRRALVAADEFQLNIGGAPWPERIADMRDWTYPNGETFAADAWALLEAHDEGPVSLVIVTGAVGDARIAAFLDEEARRLGIPLATLKEDYVAHDRERFVNTGNNARASAFGVDVKLRRDGVLEHEFVVGGGVLRADDGSVTGPLTPDVVEALILQLKVGVSVRRGRAAVPPLPATAALLEGAAAVTTFSWPDLAATTLTGTQKEGPSVLHGFVPSTGEPISLNTSSFGMGGPFHVPLFAARGAAGGAAGGGSGGDAVSPSTPAQRARMVLSVLAQIPRGIVDAQPCPGSEAVLTPAEQAALDAVASSEKEAGIVRFLTPVIARLRGLGREGHGDACALLLVNSERLPWLENPAVRGHSDLWSKPDLFCSWAPFVALSEGGAGQGVGPEYVFGVLGGAALQRLGCVGELYLAKRGALTPGQFGELVAYHDCFDGVVRGVLFGPRAFWLYKSVHRSPVQLVKARWTDAGSVDVFRDFFARAAVPSSDDVPDADAPEPPLLALLRVARSRLGATPRHLDNGRCFLGAGASGAVFAVGARDAGGSVALRALKLVLAPQTLLVAEEYARMRAVAAAAGDVVIAPVEGSLVTDDLGGGFLLERVGTSVDARTRGACRGAFAALARLHAAGATHGDARLPNLLRVDDGGLRWIDLLNDFEERGEAVFQHLAREDAELLARSALRAAAPATLPGSVRDALDAYAGGSAAAAAALADAVWAARGGS